MRWILMVMGLAMLATSTAHAQDEPLPERVAQAYLAYETAMASGDEDAASRAARTAWQAARDARIDPELVGILAENYGVLALRQGENEGAQEAWRAAALISDRLNAPAAERALRWHQVSVAAFAKGDADDARRFAQRASEVEAEAGAPLDTQLSGDIHYMLAMSNAETGREDQTGQHARLALAAFAASGRTPDRVLGNAHFLAGIGSFASGQPQDGVFDFYTASRIFEALDDPDPAEILRASMWARLAGARLTEEELMLLEAQIAASAFPFHVENSPSVTGDAIDAGDHAAQPLQPMLPRFGFAGADRGREEVIYVRASRIGGGSNGTTAATAVFPRRDEGRPPVAIDAQNSDARPLRRIEPQYPSSAGVRGQGGAVVVDFSVTENGRVDRAEIVGSIPARVFDQASLQAVRQWRYHPALRDGNPVRQDHVQAMFVFLVVD